MMKMSIIKSVRHVAITLSLATAFASQGMAGEDENPEKKETISAPELLESFAKKRDEALNLAQQENEEKARIEREGKTRLAAGESSEEVMRWQDNQLAEVNKMTLKRKALEKEMKDIRKASVPLSPLLSKEKYQISQN